MTHAGFGYLDEFLYVLSGFEISFRGAGAVVTLTPEHVLWPEIGDHPNNQIGTRVTVDIRAFRVATSFFQLVSDFVTLKANLAAFPGNDAFEFTPYVAAPGNMTLRFSNVHGVPWLKAEIQEPSLALNQPDDELRPFCDDQRNEPRARLRCEFPLDPEFLATARDELDAFLLWLNGMPRTGA